MSMERKGSIATHGEFEKAQVIAVDDAEYHSMVNGKPLAFCEPLSKLALTPNTSESDLEG
jgi:hypothetical protein